MSEPQIHDDLAAMVGSVLANTYRLDALIGEGGMGAVFRGRDVLQRRDVAIKVLHPDFSRDPELAKRFEREAKSAKRLSHPNCIQIIEFGETDEGMKYLVMQLLEGTELQNTVDGAVEPARAVDLILQVLRGLEHAHTQGVVHRDLKPQNIFVTREADGSQVLKLVDFGIAKIVAGDGAHEQMTRAGMVFGTPQYMSPEQALGMEIDARADLYAVGVLLYQLVTGKLPFNSDDPVALIRMQVSVEPPQLPSAVPQELAAVIMRLLAKQKEQRFPDARTVRMALERYRGALDPKNARAGGDMLIDVVTTGGPDLSGLVSVAKPLPDALRPRPMTLVESMMDRDSLHRRTWFRVLLVLLVLGGGFAAWWFVLRTPTTETATAPTDEPKGTSKPTPVPDAPVAATAPSIQELSAIDELVTQNKIDEAATRLRAVHAQFPNDPEVRWREASVQAQRPGSPAAAIGLYSEALKLDPELAHNLGFHAQVDGVLRKRPISDTAIDLAIALGPQGHGVLLNYINDAEGWASFAQRQKIRGALGNDITEVDTTLNTRRDLEQVLQSATPCQTMKAALTTMQAAPDRAFVEPLKAAAAPKPPADAPEAEATACRELDPLLATLRVRYAQAFPDAFPQPKKPAKKRRRR